MNSDIEHIKTQFEKLEPEGCDTWNPLSNDTELWHRLRLFTEMTHVLRFLKRDPHSIRVLDVGCGVGRSSRMLIELGVLPENITGIDFRDNAIDTARRLNPSINYSKIDSLKDWPEESFDLCIQCTAFSSIPGHKLRVETACKMQNSVGMDGFVFWWDLINANDFAGGDHLSCKNLFSEMEIVYWKQVSLRPSFSEASMSLPKAGRYFQKLLKRVPTRKTHLCALFSAINGGKSQ